MKLMGMSAVALAMALSACGGGGSSNAPSACGAGLGAHTLSGTVSAVHDGDTLTLIHSTGSEQVRLQGIDAPELAQAWGTSSQLALQSLVHHQPVTVVFDQRDRYTRLLGHVFSTGCDHINLRLLREGMAWYYRAYACDLPASLRTPFNQAESTAQQQQQGLWRQVSPVAPWIFRNGEDAPEPVCTN
jgi:endonuclease YncB( thermonuclease family)